MIRVSVVYPNEAGKRFDRDYYVKHVAEAKGKLSSLGLARVEMDRGIGTMQTGAPPPFVAVTHLYFNSPEDEQRCRVLAAELMADIPNYTDIRPVIQISEIV